MDSGVKKVALTLLLLAIVLPFLPKLVPEPLSFERFQAGFQAAGLAVEDFHPVSPSMEAVEQVQATVGGALVNIYRYDNEGKIAKHLEYQKQDPGAAMVESWGLAQSLGAAVPQQTPSRSARRKRFLLTVSGPDEAVLNTIVRAFQNS